MRVLVSIGHPGHVHFYKHIVARLQASGHEVHIVVRDKDVTLALLDALGWRYRVLSREQSGSLGMLTEFVEQEIGLLRLLWRLRPDVMTAIGGAFIAPAGKLSGCPTVVFTDSEHVGVDRYTTYPFSTAICTPTCFKKDLGTRHVRYDGYQELAYLHPDVFTPDPLVLETWGLTANERFILLRFVAWRATHDRGQSGFSPALRERAVKELSRFGRVLVSAEGALPPPLEPYRITAAPDKIHHLMAFAALVLTEGATMATEAALLGTPAVYCSSLVGTMGNFEELETCYELVRAFRDPTQALCCALELAQSRDVHRRWQANRGRLLAEKIDVNDFALHVLTRVAQGKSL